MEKHSDYNKIKQLFRSDKTNRKIGMELLKSTEDVDLLVQLTTDPSYISGHVRYYLIPYFQQRPEIWQQILPKLPNYQKRYYKERLQYEILEIEDKPSLARFCSLATKVMKKKYRGFPKLSTKILTKRNPYGVGCSQKGSSIEEGIGWTLYTDERDLGPAETIHEEEWIATAHHPEGNFIIQCDPTYDPARAWMKKIETS